jgi:hypothetical protein
MMQAISMSSTEEENKQGQESEQYWHSETETQPQT